MKRIADWLETQVFKKVKLIEGTVTLEIKAKVLNNYEQQHCLHTIVFF